MYFWQHIKYHIRWFFEGMELSIFHSDNHHVNDSAVNKVKNSCLHIFNHNCKLIDTVQFYLPPYISWNQNLSGGRSYKLSPNIAFSKLSHDEQG